MALPAPRIRRVGVIALVVAAALATAVWGMTGKVVVK